MNKRFLDYDFTKDSRFVAGDLGVGKTAKFASYGDTAPVYPESKWKEMADEMAKSGGGCSALVTRIYNQKQEGSCVANACSQAHEIVQALQFGKDNVVHMSAMSLYKRIGSGPSSGAVVSDGLDEMVKRGLLPLDDEANKKKFKHTMPNTGWSTPYPQGWEETAKLFLADEFTVCDTIEELISALFNGHPVVVGRSGHSICYCEPLYQDGSLVVKYANSWGDWGDKGYGYDSRGLISSSSRWAFALRSTVVRSW